MGFDFTLIAPLLLSHYGFSSVLGRGVSSLVKSSVFLSMIVQQPVVILVLSQEGVRARPSTSPSWLISETCILTGSSGYCVETRLKGSRVEAGRPWGGYSSNPGERRRWLGPGGRGGGGKGWLDSGDVLEVGTTRFPDGLNVAREKIGGGKRRREGQRERGC